MVDYCTKCSKYLDYSHSYTSYNMSFEGKKYYRDINDRKPLKCMTCHTTNIIDKDPETCTLCSCYIYDSFNLYLYGQIKYDQYLRSEETYVETFIKKRKNTYGSCSLCFTKKVLTNIYKNLK